MMIQLAVVGHPSSIAEIQEIMREKFSNIQAYGIHFSGDADGEAAARQLRETLPRCDGVLYTRQDPYTFMMSRVDHGGLPVRYVDIDASSFVHSLLMASHHLHRDICRVSVDTLGHATIAQAYASLGIAAHQTDIHRINVDIEAERFVQSAADMHARHFRGGQCDLCVTNVRSVSELLQREGIPCALMVPSTEAYIYEIRRLIISNQLQRTADSKFSMLSIVASTANEQYAHPSSFMLELMDGNRAGEIVAQYAQKIGGVYIVLGRNSYLIFCEYQSLAAETGNLSRLALLESVCQQTTYTLSIGIGIGASLQQIHALANLGTQRALRENGNRAYVVYAPNNMVGPIEPNEMPQHSDLLLDQWRSRVAAATGLSLNTILRMDALVKQKQNRSFTIQELADDLHVSARTANRISTKLEKSGYIIEAGRMVTGDKGRPTRIFRAMW